MGGSTSKAKEYVADRTGYSGSDAEKAANKVTEEGSKVVEKTKEEGTKIAKGDVNIKRAVTGTMAGAEETFKRSDIGRKGAEFQDYLKDRFGMVDKDEEKRRARAQTQGPGEQQTVGQGGVEGLKGGGQMAAGQRSRTRQNKRKLRIQK